jgi:hypothetical protein
MPKRRSTAFLAYGVFLAVVLVTGAALTAAGFDENPFDQLAFMISFTQNGNAFELEGAQTTQFALPETDAVDASATAPEGFALPDLGTSTDSSDTSTSQTDGFALPDLDTATPSAVEGSSDASTSALPSRPDGDFGGGRGGSQGLNWSDFGSVLYNLWFIAAVTAVVIPVQVLIRFVIRQTKRRPTAAVAA